MEDSNAQQSNTRSTHYKEWIHCNQCYEQYVHKRRNFYLLACDHVICIECIQNISDTTVNGPQIFKCSLCSKRTRACRLGTDMPSYLMELFHPEPYSYGLKTYSIMCFQEKHRKRFMEYLDRQSSALQDKKKEVLRIKGQARKHYRELEELINERKQLGKRVLNIKHQRNQLEERRKTPSGTSSTSQSSEHKKIKTQTATNVTSEGITSFSHHSRKHTFIL